MFTHPVARLAVTLCAVATASILIPNLTKAQGGGGYTTKSGQHAFNGCASTACGNLIDVQRDVRRRVDSITCVMTSTGWKYWYTTHTGNEFTLDDLCCGSNTASSPPTLSSGAPCPLP